MSARFEKALREVAGRLRLHLHRHAAQPRAADDQRADRRNKVIVPVQCEYLSMRGLVQLQNTLKMIQENLNPDVRIEGILPTMLDARTVHAKEAVEILEENFGDLVFKSRIKKAIKFAEAPGQGRQRPQVRFREQRRELLPRAGEGCAKNARLRLCSWTVARSVQGSQRRVARRLCHWRSAD